MTFDLMSVGASEVWIYIVDLYENPDRTSPHTDASNRLSPTWSLGAFSFDPATYPIILWQAPRAITRSSM